MTGMILQGDSLERLRELPDNSVHCCITSPPYFGLRDYGHAGQMGLEPTPDEFVTGMVELFREVHRVLRDDGTLWLNIGDSYASRSTYNAPQSVAVEAGWKDAGRRPNAGIPDGCKQKDLIGIPWMLAFALRADGWYLRQDIIWDKPNPMPESVGDRCTKAHEYLFLLTKSPRYFYDAEAIKEEAATANRAGWVDNPDKDKQRGHSRRHAGFNGRYAERIREEGAPLVRNKRSVWRVSTKPFKEAHFATFPPDLIEPCILAGTSEAGVCGHCGTPWQRIIEKGEPLLEWQQACGGDANGGYGGQAIKNYEGTGAQNASDVKRRILDGMREKVSRWVPGCECNARVVKPVVLDPFFGAGTTGLVAEQLGRNYIGCELNPEYVEIAKRRLVAALVPNKRAARHLLALAVAA